MPEKNEVMIETVDATVNEVAKNSSDKTGIIFVGAGVAIGIGLTLGVVKGAKVIKKKISVKKALKNAPKKRREILEAAAEAE